MLMVCVSTGLCNPKDQRFRLALRLNVAMALTVSANTVRAPVHTMAV
jgi:hypothetical protein